MEAENCRAKDAKNLITRKVVLRLLENRPANPTIRFDGVHRQTSTKYPWDAAVGKCYMKKQQLSPNSPYDRFDGQKNYEKVSNHQMRLSELKKLL